MNTLKSIYCDSTRPMKLVMMLTYIITTVALYLRHDDHTGDARYIFEAFHMSNDAHLVLWSLICLYCATARYVGLFWWKGLVWTRRTTPLAGMVLWAFLFTSAVKSTEFGFGLLYIICLLIETWILSRAFAESKLGID